MINLLMMWLVDGMIVSGRGRLLLSLPLCLGIAIVYKSLRCASMNEVPRAALTLWITIVVTMYSIGIGLWLAFGWLA